MRIRDKKIDVTIIIFFKNNLIRYFSKVFNISKSIIKFGYNNGI